MINAPIALFEDNLGVPARAHLLTRCRQHIRCTKPQDLEYTLARTAALQKEGAWIAMAAAYELGYVLEPRLSHLLPSPCPEPLLEVWAFDEHALLEGEALEAWWAAQLAALTPQQREAGILAVKAGWQEAAHAEQAEKALAYIRDGHCYQVNLTFPISGLAYGSPLALFHRLRAVQPVRHGALILGRESSILSRSPELFVEKRQTTLRCRPMKGTALRTGTRDDEAAAEALASPKNVAENLMIVDLIRNDLGRLVPAGGVKVEKLFEREDYPSVFQLTSTVAAAPVTAALPEILRALFPCGSVTGAPKRRAMEIISELEQAPRGVYCGALGWLSPDGDFSFNVPIRTLRLDPAGRMRLEVGSGIVADSDAASEYAECIGKARFATQLREEIQLIETLRYEPGNGFCLLHRHMHRLQASAAAIDFPCSKETVERALIAHGTQLCGGPHRVRVTLDQQGRIEISSAPLEPLHGPVRVTWAAFALQSRDPRLQHKTTARRFYDMALQTAMRDGYFDVLFVNEKGELAEGARSSIFVETQDGILATPPLASGVLPGVLRAELIAQGRASERRLTRQDLEAPGARLWVGNALRGLLPASLETS